MDLAPADPAAKADHRDENELDALPRRWAIAAKENEGHPVSGVFLGHGHRQRVAEDEQVADQALESAAQVRARHHGVADHVEARGPRDMMLRECDRRIAGALDRKLPQATDLFGRQAHSRGLQRRRVDSGGDEQCARVEALGGKHLGDALHPDGGCRPFSHLRPSRGAGWHCLANRLAASVTDLQRRNV